MRAPESAVIDVEIRVQLAALRRRLEQLEVFVSGHTIERPSDRQLLGIYTEATLTLSQRRVATTSARAWAHAAMVLDEEDLLRLGRLVMDPHPFVPIAQMLIALSERGDADEVEAALAHVEDVAQGVLDAQGLGLIRLGDLLARPLPLVEHGRSVFDAMLGERDVGGGPDFPEGSVPSRTGRRSR